MIRQFSMATRLILIVLLFSAVVFAQPEDLTQIWPAHWIKAENGPEKDFGVFYFRRRVKLDTLPKQLIVHTSGDNRYQLYVNGTLAVWGPQRGDTDHWIYESTDIAPFMHKGDNVLAVLVWNYGAWPPDAQFSVQTAFLLAAGEKTYRSWNTDEQWKAVYNPAYRPIPPDQSQISGYFGSGATEAFDARAHLWGWRESGFDDSGWLPAQNIETAKARTCIWAGRWKLQPRRIKAEPLHTQRFKAVRLAEGVQIPEIFPLRPADIKVPAESAVRLIFDQGVETTAFPQLEYSGGAQAEIQLKYVEAPYVENSPRNREKGNRHVIDGKYFLGVYDRMICDGGSSRLYQPLWWRAFRYIEMTIQTRDDPLVIHDFRSQYTGYPFVQQAEFEVSGDDLPVTSDVIQDMLEVGEHTVRLCAHETYMDCPYYEQTQFEGDTRVQALVSYYNFGDPALSKNAIQQFDWSRNEQGFLSARYPANSTYYIPNFSIFWIGMLYDYMMHVGDREFIRSKLQGVRSVLHYFLEHRRPDGSIRRPDFHNFVDWSFPRGEAPFDDQGYSALVDLHVLMALQWAAELESWAGEKYFETLHRNTAGELKSIIEQYYWRPERGLYADTRYNQEMFSVHTNCMAVLTGTASGEKAGRIMNRVLETETLTQPTVYWHFYLFEAMHMAGLGNRYLENTGLWQQMLNAGCTTWPETGLESRSECHGWGASPNYHIYKILLGVRSVSPGFEKVIISPHGNGALKMSGSIPHPRGEVRVEMHNLGTKEPTAVIMLPEGIVGTFIWNGNVYDLHPNEQMLNLTMSQ